MVFGFIKKPGTSGLKDNKTDKITQGKNLISGLKYQRSARDSLSEVIIGISRAVEALIKGTFILSLFLAINYGNIKALFFSDCYIYDLNFL